MLEVHPDPENSAVDPLQPINYENFKSLINEMNTISQQIYKRNILSK
jgi:3-deoxy-7-phosphoheptulonate synthase